MSVAPVALELARGRGWRWGELDGELAGRLAAWAERGPDAECEPFKPGRVWRWREVVLKRFDDSLLERLGLRECGALRAARRALTLPDGTAARPVAAVAVAGGGSLLASEFVDGATMLAAWRSDPRCVAALPGFLARLHAAGVFHGDLHPGNLLWSGERWVLLDIESVRHPLRTLARRSQALDQWARLHYRLKGDARVRSAFEEYVRIAGRNWDVGRTWDEVLARIPALDAVRGGAPLP